MTCRKTCHLLLYRWFFHCQNVFSALFSTTLLAITYFWQPGRKKKTLLPRWNSFTCEWKVPPQCLFSCPCKRMTCAQKSAYHGILTCGAWWMKSPVWTRRVIFWASTTIATQRDVTVTFALSKSSCGIDRYYFYPATTMCFCFFYSFGTDRNSSSVDDVTLCLDTFRSGDSNITHRAVQGVKTPVERPLWPKGEQQGLFVFLVACKTQ